MILLLEYMNYALGVTGYPGAGKSVVTSIAEEIGFKKVSMGDQIRRRTREDWGDKLERAENGVSDETPSEVYGQYATVMRDMNGKGIVAEWCGKEISENDSPVVIDGMRSPEERDAFEGYVNMDVLFIHAPASLRFEWIKNRARDNEDAFTFESFMNRDERENNWGLNELIQDSDFVVHNCTSEYSFEQDITDLLTDIRGLHW